MPPKTTFDIIAIGESLRDVFYMIDEATVSCTIDKERCYLCLDYGEKIPVKQIVKVPAAGNSGNAAVGASRLGMKSALVSWVGKDDAGDGVRRALQKDKVDHRYIVIDEEFPTSEATILNYQRERTQLVYFQPRNYKMPHLASTRCIYYSAMGITHAKFDRILLREIDRQKNALFVFQPGTTHIRRGIKALKPLISRSGLFILNKEEAHRLLEDGDRTIPNMLEMFSRVGAKIVVITNGKDGAHCFDGKRHVHMPIFDGLAKEPTGAGDSFAIGVTVAVLKGKPISEALRWGTANSWSVIREIGPQTGLLTTKGIERILKKFSATKPIHIHTM